MTTMNETNNKIPSPLLGTFNLGRNGIGYVRNKEIETSIEIPAHERGNAMNKDEVEVVINEMPEDSLPVGQVVRILKRAKHGFAGKLAEYKNGYAVEPSNEKDDIFIIIEDVPNEATVGDKVYAEVTDWLDNTREVKGVIKKILGKPGENDAEMLSFALEKGFDNDFSPEVLRDAKRIKEEHNIEEGLKERRDLRDRNVLTIDPEDAKDFDDALSVKKLDNGLYEIGVHIADVAHFLKPNTDLDREARERATSVYLVDRTIPMLPEILSNDLCSLNPGEDKFAFSALFTMGADGTVHKEWFGRTVIHSKKRFSYEEAQDVLDDNKGPFVEELQLLNSLAKKLAKDRFDAGAINMDHDEVKFLLNEEGHPVDVFLKKNQETNKLIEEFMLLANRKVAKFMSEKTKRSVFVYRIHDKPALDRVQNLRQFLGQLGHTVPIKNGVIPAEYLQRILNETETKDEKETIQTAIIRSMAKAIYSTENHGHYGLGFQYYTHFTSPIRRYPDVMVHRLLWMVLNEKNIDPKLAEEYKRLADHSSGRERDAQYAEWDSIKYKQVQYMSDRIGQIFEGVIAGMNKNGLFISEKRSKADGMVRLRNLPGDFYRFDEKKFIMKGERTGKIYKIGDIVPIKVLGADIEKLQIDYAVPTESSIKKA